MTNYTKLTEQSYEVVFDCDLKGASYDTLATASCNLEKLIMSHTNCEYCKPVCSVDLRNLVQILY